MTDAESKAFVAANIKRMKEKGLLDEDYQNDHSFPTRRAIARKVRFNPKDIDLTEEQWNERLYGSGDAERFESHLRDIKRLKHRSISIIHGYMNPKKLIWRVFLVTLTLSLWPVDEDKPKDKPRQPEPTYQPITRTHTPTQSIDLFPPSRRSGSTTIKSWGNNTIIESGKIKIQLDIPPEDLLDLIDEDDILDYIDGSID